MPILIDHTSLKVVVTCWCLSELEVAAASVKGICQQNDRRELLLKGD